MIKKTDKIMDVINKYPETYPILLGFGVHCIGCAFASFETIEQAAQAHGMEPEDLIKALNKVIAEKQKDKKEEKPTVI